MFKFLSRPFQFYPGYIGTKCCHPTKRKGVVVATQCVTDHAVLPHELRTYTCMSLNKSGQVDWCLECIGKMATPCAWCRKPIFIGDPITLYCYEAVGAKGEKRRIVPLNLDATKHKVFVGCLRRNCADSGADRAGFWVPGENGKGSAYRIPNAYEMILRGGKNDGGVVINDLSSMGEAKRMISRLPS